MIHTFFPLLYTFVSPFSLLFKGWGKAQFLSPLFRALTQRVNLQQFVCVPAGGLRAPAQGVPSPSRSPPRVWVCRLPSPWDWKTWKGFCPWPCAAGHGIFYMVPLTTVECCDQRTDARRPELVYERNGSERFLWKRRDWTGMTYGCQSGCCGLWNACVPIREMTGALVLIESPCAYVEKWLEPLCSPKAPVLMLKEWLEPLSSKIKALALVRTELLRMPKSNTRMPSTCGCRQCMRCRQRDKCGTEIRKCLW